MIQITDMVQIMVKKEYKAMKDEKIDEIISTELTEENLEEVSGGLNNMHAKIGGYADGPSVMHPVLNSDTDAANVHPVINAKDKVVPTHPVMKEMLGSPVLVDTNDIDKSDSNGGHGSLA